MARRWTVGLVLAVCMGVVVAAATWSCKSSSAAGLAGSCSINSDCDSPLVCAFGRCHAACATSRDCPTGETCLVTGSGGVCQLPQEAACTTTASCGSPTLVCAMGPGIQGQECRSSCTITADCAGGQQCLPQTPTSSACVDTSTGIDAGTDGSTDGSSGGDGSGPSDTGSSSDGSVPKDGSSKDGGGQDTGVVTNMCPSAQTQFGNIAQGDMNGNFTSAVGVRTATELLLFSGYTGPSPSGFDAGSPDAGSVNLVYLQAFDATTAASKGPARVLFEAAPISTVGAPAGTPLMVLAASVAPTGEIAVLYNYGEFFEYSSNGSNTYGLLGAFLAGGADAGSSTLQVKQNLTLESAAIYGQPHAIWSVTSGAFVLSWEYVVVGVPIGKVKKFLPGGAGAGGDTDVVPSTGANNSFWNGDVENGTVGVSGQLFGVAYAAQSPIADAPSFTALGATGNIVGASFAVASTSGSPYWEALAGTSTSFIYFADDHAAAGSVDVYAIPTASMAAFGADGGPPTTTFSFPIRAIGGRAVNDDVGGTGGVGVALLYSDGLSFAYVNADGMTHLGPDQVVSHIYAAGDEFHVNNFGGSFGVSLYSVANHSAQIASSGCGP
jgi:hypothetical protein